VHFRLKKKKTILMTDSDLNSFLEKVFEMKLSELFEEPSTYEDYVDNEFVLSGIPNNSFEV
jgi:hypothetical protein